MSYRDAGRRYRGYPVRRDERCLPSPAAARATAWEYTIFGSVLQASFRGICLCRLWDELYDETRLAVFLTARLAERRNSDSHEERLAAQLFQDEEMAKRANAWGLSPDVRNLQTMRRLARAAATEMYPVKREDVVRHSVPVLVNQLKIDQGDARELLTAADDDPDRAIRCWTEAVSELALAWDAESVIPIEERLSLAIRLARGDAGPALHELKVLRLRNRWGGDADDARQLLRATNSNYAFASEVLREAWRRLGDRGTIPEQFAIAEKIARERNSTNGS